MCVIIIVTTNKGVTMSLIKTFLYEIEEEGNQPSITELEKYELYCLYQTLKEKGVNEEYFETLMSEGEE